LKGTAVIYASESRLLAQNEFVAHAKKGGVTPLFQVINNIEIKDDASMIEINKSQLPKDWKSIPGPFDLQVLGTAWVNRQDSLVLKVPSVISDEYFNYVINPEHPEFKDKVKVVGMENHDIDPRLLE